jgi:hypothetical protein
MKKGNTTSKFGGNLTVKQLEEYVVWVQESAELNVQLYIAYHVNKKSLRRVGDEFGLSHQQVKNRLSSMLGFVNSRITSDPAPGF